MCYVLKQLFTSVSVKVVDTVELSGAILSGHSVLSGPLPKSETFFLTSLSFFTPLVRKPGKKSYGNGVLEDPPPLLMAS